MRTRKRLPLRLRSSRLFIGDPGNSVHFGSETPQLLNWLLRRSIEARLAPTGAGDGRGRDAGRQESETGVGRWKRSELVEGNGISGRREQGEAGNQGRERTRMLGAGPRSPRWGPGVKHSADRLTVFKEGSDRAPPGLLHSYQSRRADLAFLISQNAASDQCTGRGRVGSYDQLCTECSELSVSVSLGTSEAVPASGCGKLWADFDQT
jgi:hypothetical protein